MRVTSRGSAVAVTLVALILPLGSCGGGDDSSKQQASSDTTAGTTGTTGASGRDGASGSTGSTGGKGHSKGNAKPQKTSSSGGSGGTTTTGGSKKQTGGKQQSANKHKRKTKTSGPDPNYTPQQYELYKQSKVVCGSISLSGLAAQYHVAHTPSAVAAAYAKAYVDTFKTPQLHDAVQAGCKAGVGG
jgi:hypothetical protein